MTDKKLMEKMRKDAEKFRTLCCQRQYVGAINLYHKVYAVAHYTELPQENLEELFGNYYKEDENTIIVEGLFRKDMIIYVSDMAMKQELEENRRGNPTQIHDFKHYLPQSTLKKPVY